MQIFEYEPLEPPRPLLVPGGARKLQKTRFQHKFYTSYAVVVSPTLPTVVAEIDQFKVYKMYFFISRFWRKPQGITLCFPYANLQISKGPNDFKLSYLSDQEELERQPQHRMCRICAGNTFFDVFAGLLAPEGMGEAPNVHIQKFAFTPPQPSILLQTRVRPT